MGSKFYISRMARYEATVSTGLEELAEKEIIEKLGAKTEIQKGRVLIETEKPVPSMIQLKSINNLFVIIYDGQVEQDKMPQNAEQLQDLLMIIGDQCEWELGLTKWIEASHFDRCSLETILKLDPSSKAVQPSFRVSSNRYGPEHKFTSPEICSMFGHVIDTKFGWPIKMKNFDLQVYANFSKNHLYVTLTLTPISLDCRNIISTGYTTLKASTCYALLRVANVQPGDIVFDPMAGSGAIPVENMAAWNDQEWYSFSLSGDITTSILAKAKINMHAFHGTERVPPGDLMVADVTMGCVRDDSIDVIVSDLPFGRRHGTKYHNRVLYPKMMQDFSRICRLGTGRAVLLTQDFKSINIAYDTTKNYWTQARCSHVKIGNLNCWIYLFTRTGQQFKEEIYN